MTSASLILVGGVTVCSICGGAAFKQFTLTHEPHWLILGFLAYNLSNIGWLLMIDQVGLARSTVIAGGLQILALTLIGAMRGETLDVWAWSAAVLVCIAIALSSLGRPESTPYDATKGGDTSLPPSGEPMGPALKLPQKPKGDSP